MKKTGVLYLFACLLGFSAKAQSYFTITVTTTKYSCVDGTAHIAVSGGQAPYFYNWSSGAQGETVAGLLPGSYNVSIVDGLGHDTLIGITIEEEKCKVSFSTSFSPNHDDINDTWTASNLSKYPDFTLEVYNRWGERVHQQKGGDYKPWDGKQLSIDVPVGTYYYIFYYKGTSGDLEKGSVTLMR